MSMWEWMAVFGVVGLLAFLVVSVVVLVYALERVRDVGVALCERADAIASVIDSRTETTGGVVLTSMKESDWVYDDSRTEDA